MPHVLYQWQGTRAATFEGGGVADVSSVRYQSVVPGTMTGREYDAAIRDLTNFMVYLAEPAKLVRYEIGFWVMLFMGVFIVLAYLLKKEYWRDVH
jgi:ubiquinol-cytochrome c reductase cytochrome c1 subunit